MMPMAFLWHLQPAVTTEHTATIRTVKTHILSTQVSWWPCTGRLGYISCLIHSSIWDDPKLPCEHNHEFLSNLMSTEMLTWAKPRCPQNIAAFKGVPLILSNAFTSAPASMSTCWVHHMSVSTQLSHGYSGERAQNDCQMNFNTDMIERRMHPHLCYLNTACYCSNVKGG